MTRRFRRNLLIGLVAPTVAVFWMGAQVYRDVTRLIAISEDVERSRDRLGRLAEVDALLKDAESGQRGRLLTSRVDYLQTYEGSRAGAKEMVGELARRSPGEETRRLAEAVDEKFDEMGRTLDLSASGDREAALAMVQTGRGETLKREIVGALGRLASAERATLAVLKREAAASAVGSVRWLSARLGMTLVMALGLYAIVTVEIRRRRHVESVLRESEGRFRGSFDAAAIGMALVAPDGRFLRVNRALCECVGYSEEELLDRDFQSITHPADLDGDLALLRRVVAGEIDSYQFEKRYFHKSGREVFVLLGVSVVRDAAGRALHFVSQIEDVTARVHAERELREEHRFIESIADSLPLTLYLFDLDRRCNVWSNARNTEVFSLTTDEMAAMDGLWVERLVHPDDLPAIAAHQARLALVPDGEVCEVEYRAKHIDGQWRWFRSRDVVYQRGTGGRPVQILGSGEDVTERRRADAELATARAQLADAIDSLDSGFVRYNADDRLAVCNRRVREIYPMAAEFMTPGATFEEILRGSIRAHAEAGGLPCDEGLIAEQIEAHRSFRGVDERQIGERWVRVATSSTADGGVVRLHTDITETKRAEDDLRRARDDARAAERVKADFLANMSHEIRTPMNGVMGMAELALGTRLSSRQREYVATIRSSAEGLLTVINDILDFSKVEAGKLQLDRAPFGLRACLDDTLRPFAARAVKKGLELCVRVDPRAPDILLGDPHRLRQVLINLVGNAIKFTERGEVVVSVECGPEGDPSDASVTLAFSVADTGIGIPEGRRAAIFEPFEQADSSTTRKFGGTGLGLAISAKLVALMGGSIEVEGRPGGGSLFRVTATFGRPLADEIRPHGIAAVPPGLAGTSVLIVVDGATSRAILAETVADWRMEPIAVADAASALGLILAARSKGSRIAAALVDGDAAARAVSAEAAESGIPLILLTTDDPAAPPADPHLDCAARLTKPVRQSELFDAFASLDGPARSGAHVPDAPAAAAERPERPLRILLAEDNPVNQMVALRMLERLGHLATAVDDGRAALVALDSGLFDLVLMDISMPEMDGFEAVAEVRRRESAAGSGHIPVAALTAHAMTGDRERCLSAGFDAYLSKPIRIADLSATLADLLASGLAPTPAPAAASEDTPTLAAFRAESLSEICGGDPEIIAEVLDTFLTEAPADLGRIANALDARDHRALGIASHGLKGTCLTVGAEALAETCRQLEALADAPSYPAPFRARLDREWSTLATAIEAHRRDEKVLAAAH